MATTDYFLGAAASGASGVDGNTLTVSHTLDAGNNRMVVVALSTRDVNEQFPDTLTYNSDITFRSDSDALWNPAGNTAVGLYYLLDSDLPAPGSYNVTATWGTNQLARMMSIQTLQNISQSAPALVYGSDEIAGTDVSVPNTAIDPGDLFVNAVISESTNAWTHDTDTIEPFLVSLTPTDQSRKVVMSAGAFESVDTNVHNAVFQRSSASTNSWAVKYALAVEAIPAAAAADNAILFSIAI